MAAITNELLALLAKLARSGAGMGRAQALREEIQHGGRLETDVLNALIARVRQNPGDIEAVAKLQGLHPETFAAVQRPAPLPRPPRPKIDPERVVRAKTEPVIQEEVAGELEPMLKRIAQRFGKKPTDRSRGTLGKEDQPLQRVYEPGMSTEDLEQVGRETIHKIMPKFDPNVSPVEDFIAAKLHRDMGRYAKHAKAPVSIPEPASKMERDIWRYVDQFSEKYGHKPSDVLIGYRFKIAPSMVRNIMQGVTEEGNITGRGGTKLFGRSTEGMTSRQRANLGSGVEARGPGATRHRTPGAGTEEFSSAQTVGEDPLSKLIGKEAQKEREDAFVRAIRLMDPEHLELIKLSHSGDPVAAQAKAAGMTLRTYQRKVAEANKALRDLAQRLKAEPPVEAKVTESKPRPAIEAERKMLPPGPISGGSGGTNKMPPVEYAGYQAGYGNAPGFHQYTLTEPVGKHPAGSTLSEHTLRELGIELPRPISGAKGPMTGRAREADIGRILDETVGRLRHPGKEPDPRVIKQLEGGMTKQNRMNPESVHRPRHPMEQAILSGLDNEVSMREHGLDIKRSPLPGTPEYEGFPYVQSEPGPEGQNRRIMELIEEVWGQPMYNPKAQRIIENARALRHQLHDIMQPPRGPRRPGDPLPPISGGSDAPDLPPYQARYQQGANERINRINAENARFGMPPIGHEGAGEAAPLSGKQPAGGTLPMGQRSMKDAKKAKDDQARINDMLSGGAGDVGPRSKPRTKFQAEQQKLYDLYNEKGWGDPLAAPPMDVGPLFTGSRRKEFRDIEGVRRSLEGGSTYPGPKTAPDDMRPYLWEIDIGGKGEPQDIYTRLDEIIAEMFRSRDTGPTAPANANMFGPVKGQRIKRFSPGDLLQESARAAEQTQFPLHPKLQEALRHVLGDRF